MLSVEQRRSFTVGLPKKKEENDMDQYKNMSINYEMGHLQMEGALMNEFVQSKINQMK